MAFFKLDEDRCILRDQERFEKHGQFMFIMWFFFGYGILITKRYMKPFWVCTDICHSVLGYLVCMMTMMTTFFLAKDQGFDMGIHALFGYVMAMLAFFLFCQGTAMLGLRCCQHEKWTTQSKAQKVAMVHRWTGRIALALGSVTLTLGGIDYANKQQTNHKLITMSWLQWPFYWGSIALIELLYRNWLNSSPVLVKNFNGLKSITPE